MLKKLFNKSRKNLGQPPGTFLNEVSKPGNEEALLIKFNEGFFEKEQIAHISKDLLNAVGDCVSWINLDSTSYTRLFQEMQDNLSVNPLILEDIVNTHQRAKFEDWDSCIFVVVKMLYFNSQEELELEQVSFVLKENLLISVQEKAGDIFNIVRSRLANNKGKVRKQGADYLLYALLDTIIDNYFVIIDDYNDYIEDLEIQIYEKFSPENLSEVQDLKKELSLIRRYISPVRELIQTMMKSESELIGETLNVYLRDLHDHAIQVNESIEMLKELSNSVVEISSMTMSNKLNEVMKVLTVISTIFIPLSFIAGLYGMNFINMPELHYPYAYPIVLGLMSLIALAMLYFFKKKNWF